MWIRLTKGDNNPVLVNVGTMSGAIAAKKGGSIIAFDEKFTSPGTRLAVEESVEEVADLMGAPYRETVTKRVPRRA